MGAGAKLLFFAEDPGAAAFLAPLYGSLRVEGGEVSVAACGVAQRIFTDRGVPFTFFDGDASLAESFLLQSGAQKLVVGTAENPRSPGLYLLAAAKKLGIPSFGAVDAFMNAARRFSGDSGDPRRFAPDGVLVPDEALREEFIRLGYAPGEVFPLGHPQFDVVAEKRRQFTKAGIDTLRAELFPGAAGGEKILIFVDEGPRRAESLQEGYFAGATLPGGGAGFGRTDLAIREFLAGVEELRRGGERIYIVLRLHPKSTEADYSEVRPIFDHFHSGGDPLRAVFCADLVVSLTSILLTEASLLGKKTMCIVPYQEEGRWLAGVKEGITPCAWTRAGVLSSMKVLVSGDADLAGIRAFCDRYSGSIPRLSRFLLQPKQ